jgi:hypothetical protein
MIAKLHPYGYTSPHTWQPTLNAGNMLGRAYEYFPGELAAAAA